MIVFRFAVILLLLTAPYAFADEASKAAKLKELAKIQGLHATEDELDSIIAFYRSPIGQKDAEAAKIAMQQWAIFFMEKNNVTVEKATQAYISELRAIIKAEAKKRNRK